MIALVINIRMRACVMLFSINPHCEELSRC
jgi:hypothetical protein